MYSECTVSAVTVQTAVSGAVSAVSALPCLPAAELQITIPCFVTCRAGQLIIPNTNYKCHIQSTQSSAGTKKAIVVVKMIIYFLL